MNQRKQVSGRNTTFKELLYLIVAGSVFVVWKQAEKEKFTYLINNGRDPMIEEVVGLRLERIRSDRKNCVGEFSVFVAIIELAYTRLPSR